MKGLIKIVVVTVLIGSVYSCNDKSKPNYQYFPNMYKSVGYETYGEYEVFPGEQEALIPPSGTLPRGYSLYEYPNTNEGYDMAKQDSKNPLDSTQIDLVRGKELYDIYCGICHGNKGKGQGKLVKNEKILGVPSYGTRDVTEGSIYHVIYYGINSMGSYSNQLNEEERWQVTAYVQKLKAEIN
ncbi:MAG: cytochrome c [Flavobacteriaceae bacterium]|nr:cytochrome c [Flavobacteriaceae bacterium]